MVNESEFPKVDGDYLYASEVNTLTASDRANALRETLGLGSSQFINRFFNFSPGTGLIGSTNMINQGGSIFPWFSGNSNFIARGVDDQLEFEDNSVGSVWGSIVSTAGAGTIVVAEESGYLIISGATTNGNGNEYMGSVFWSGTALNNMFNEYSGYMRCMFGSVMVSGAGAPLQKASIQFAGQIVFDKEIAGGGAFNVSGMMLDVMRVGSNNFYYKLNSGTAGTWGEWTGPNTLGSPSLVLYISGNADAGASGRSKILLSNIRIISGINNLEFISSGLINPNGGSTSYYTQTSLSQTVLTMHGEGNYESGVVLDLSLSRGTSYNAGSFNRWTNITSPGSTLTTRYIQSGTWYSGLQTGVVISRIAAQFY